MKRSLPILIALILCVVLCSCKSKDATAADDMILAIGEVTLDSEQDIIQAENAVNALEDKDYKQLEYLEELEKARTTYDDLVDRDDANHIKLGRAVHFCYRASQKCDSGVAAFKFQP